MFVLKESCIWSSIKILLFILLLVIFIWFYMYDQLTDFIKARTSITSRYVQVQTIEPPTISFCMSPAQKTSVANSFGFQTFNDWQNIEIEGITIEQRINKLSYILNRDFKLKQSNVLLEEGTNLVDGLEYEVKPFLAWSEGICYKIQPLFELAEEQIPWIAHFDIIFEDSLEEIDKPKRATIFLTSNSTWHGIVSETWPQFRPTEINLDLTDKEYLEYVLLTRNTQMLFHKGVANRTEDCFWAEVLKTNCSYKCMVYFDGFPKCKTIKEWKCIRSQWSPETWTDCLLKKKALKFRAKDSRVQTYTKDKSSKVWIELWSMQQEIEEEVDVITLAELIGSLGGSLGLFFGFSMFASIIFSIQSMMKKC